MCEERGGEAGRHSAEARLKVKRVTYTLSICGRESCCSRPPFVLLAAAGSIACGRESMTSLACWGNDADFEGTDYTLFAAGDGAKHCSSLCSQSEGHEHVANMVNALGYNLVIFQLMLGRRNIRPPHFASKVSYSASPQGIVECSRIAPCSDVVIDMVFALKNQGW